MKLLEKDIIKFILKELDKETSLSIIKEIKSDSYNRDFFLSVVAKLKMSTNELVEYELKKSERKKSSAKKMFSNTPVQKVETRILGNNNIRWVIANDEFLNERTQSNFIENLSPNYLNPINVEYTDVWLTNKKTTNRTNDRKDIIKDFNTTPSSC
jgi:hypothetical protein